MIYFSACHIFGLVSKKMFDMMHPDGNKNIHDQLHNIT